MHLTLETDYAIRIMDFLYGEKEKVDAKTISLHTGVTLRFSLKILRKLVSGGMIKSFKGTQGGYVIAKSKEEVSLNDIVELIEGPFTMSKCMNENFHCTRNSNKEHCKFHLIFEKISRDVTDKLSSITFADIDK